MAVLKMMSSPQVQIIINIVMAIVWAQFVWRHVEAFTTYHAWSYLLFACSESLQIIFFLIRKQAVHVADDAFSWLIAAGCTLFPLLLSPNHIGSAQIGLAILTLGIILQIIGIASLNRSFGIVAAQREIKTHGGYSIVRHPIYTSYLFLYGGYVIGNFSPTNLVIIFMTLVLLIARIIEEERLLSKDDAYRAYMERVHWRLIPGVF